MGIFFKCCKMKFKRYCSSTFFNYIITLLYMFFSVFFFLYFFFCMFFSVCFFCMFFSICFFLLVCLFFICFYSYVCFICFYMFVLYMFVFYFTCFFQLRNLAHSGNWTLNLLKHKSNFRHTLNHFTSGADIDLVYAISSTKMPIHCEQLLRSKWCLKQSFSIHAILSM